MSPAREGGGGARGIIYLPSETHHERANYRGKERCDYLSLALALPTSLAFALAPSFLPSLPPSSGYTAHCDEKTTEIDVHRLGTFVTWALYSLSAALLECAGLRRVDTLKRKSAVEPCRE